MQVLLKNNNTKINREDILQWNCSAEIKDCMKQTIQGETENSSRDVGETPPALWAASALELAYKCNVRK